MSQKPVHICSVIAMEELAATGKLSESRARVLKVLQRNLDGITCADIAAALGVGANCVSGRLIDLEAAGYVERVGASYSKATGKMGDLWAITGPQRAVLPRAVGQ